MFLFARSLTRALSLSCAHIPLLYLLACPPGISLSLTLGFGLELSLSSSLLLLALSLSCGTLPVYATVAFFLASYRSWALLGTSSLQTMVFDRVECTESTVVGLVAFLKTDASAAAVSIIDTNLDSEMLEAVVGAIPEKPNVCSLGLSDCKLDSLPSGLGAKFGNLATLTLAYNSLDEASTAEAFAGLQGLRELDLAGNNFGSFAPCLAELPKLELLDLSENAIENVEPEELQAGFTQITRCVYTGNPFLEDFPLYVQADFAALRKYVYDLAADMAFVARHRLVFVGDSPAGRTELRSAMLGLDGGGKKKPHPAGTAHTLIADAMERKAGKVDGKIDLLDIRSYEAAYAKGADPSPEDALFSLELVVPPTDAAAQCILRENFGGCSYVVLFSIGASPLEAAKDDVHQLMRWLRMIQASTFSPCKCFVVGLLAGRCSDHTVSTVLGQLDREIKGCAAEELPEIVSIRTVALAKHRSVKAVRTDVLRALRNHARTVIAPGPYTRPMFGVASANLPPPEDSATVAAADVARGRELQVHRMNEAIPLFSGLGVFSESLLSFLTECGSMFGSSTTGTRRFEHDVFLCSANRDAALAAALKQTLEKDGCSVFDASFSPPDELVIAKSRLFIVVGIAESLSAPATQAHLVTALSLSRRYGFPRICIVENNSSRRRPAKTEPLLAQKVSACFEPFHVALPGPDADDLDHATAFAEVLQYASDMIADSVGNGSKRLPAHALGSRSNYVTFNVNFLFELISTVVSIGEDDMQAGVIQHERLFEHIAAVHARTGTAGELSPDVDGIYPWEDSPEKTLEFLRGLGYCCPGPTAGSELVFRGLPAESDVGSVDPIELWLQTTAQAEVDRAAMPWAGLPGTFATPAMSVLRTEYVLTVLPEGMLGLFGSRLVNSFDFVGGTSTSMIMSTTTCCLKLVFDASDAGAQSSITAKKATVGMLVASWNYSAALQHFQTAVALIDAVIEECFPKLVLYCTVPCPMCSPSAESLATAGAKPSFSSSSGGEIKIPWPREKAEAERKKVFSGCTRCLQAGGLVTQYQVMEPFWAAPRPLRPDVPRVFVIHSSSDGRFAEALCRVLEQQGSPFVFGRCTAKDTEVTMMGDSAAVLALVSGTMLTAPACLRQLQMAHRHGLPIVSLDIESIPDSVEGALGREGHVSFDAYSHSLGSDSTALRLLSDMIATNVHQERTWSTKGFGPSTVANRKDVLVICTLGDRQEVRKLASALERRGITGWLSFPPRQSYAGECIAAEQVSTVSRLLVYNTPALAHSAFCIEQIEFAKKLGKPVSCVFADTSSVAGADGDRNSAAFGETVAAIIQESPLLAARGVDPHSVAQATGQLLDRRGSLLTVRPVDDAVDTADFLSKPQPTEEEEFAAAMRELDADESSDSEPEYLGVANVGGFTPGGIGGAIGFTDSPAVLQKKKSCRAGSANDDPYLLVASLGELDALQTPEPHARVTGLATGEGESAVLSTGTRRRQRRVDRKAKFKEMQSLNKFPTEESQGFPASHARSEYRPDVLPEVLIPKINAKGELQADGPADAKAKFEERRQTRMTMLEQQAPAVVLDTDTAAALEARQLQVPLTSPPPDSDSSAEFAPGDEEENDTNPEPGSSGAAAVAREQDEDEFERLVQDKGLLGALGFGGEAPEREVAAEPEDTTLDGAAELEAEAAAAAAERMARAAAALRAEAEHAEATEAQAAVAAAARAAAKLEAERAAKVAAAEAQLERELDEAPDEAEAGEPVPGFLDAVPSPVPTADDHIDDRSEDEDGVADLDPASATDASMRSVGRSLDGVMVSREGSVLLDGFEMHRGEDDAIFSPMSMPTSPGVPSTSPPLSDIDIDTLALSPQMAVLADVPEPKPKLAAKPKPSPKPKPQCSSTPIPTEEIAEPPKPDEPAEVPDRPEKPRVGAANRSASIADVPRRRGTVSAAVWPPPKPGVDDDVVEEAPKRSATFSGGSKRVKVAPSVAFLKLAATASKSVGREQNEAEKLATIMQRASENDPTLTVFDISNFGQLKRLSKAEKEERLFEIIESLHGNTHLTELSFANIGANDFFAEELADYLRDNQLVTTVNIDTNEIYEDGFIALAGMLKKNSTLKKLLCANQSKSVPTRALHKMADVLDVNRTLTTCSIACRDATAREKLERGLARNAEIARKARVAAKRDPASNTARTKPVVVASAAPKPAATLKPTPRPGGAKIPTPIRDSKVKVPVGLAEIMPGGTSLQPPAVKQTKVEPTVLPTPDPFSLESSGAQLDVTAQRDRRRATMSGTIRRRLPTRRSRTAQRASVFQQSTSTTAAPNPTAEPTAGEDALPERAAAAPLSQVDQLRALKAQKQHARTPVNKAVLSNANDNDSDEEEEEAMWKDAAAELERDPTSVSKLINLVSENTIAATRDQAAGWKPLVSQSAAAVESDDEDALWKAAEAELAANPLAADAIESLLRDSLSPVPAATEPLAAALSPSPRTPRAVSDVEPVPTFSKPVLADLATLVNVVAPTVSAAPKPKLPQKPLVKDIESNATAVTGETPRNVTADERLAKRRADRKARRHQQPAVGDGKASPLISSRRERRAKAEKAALEEETSIEQYRLERQKKRDALKASRS